MVGTFTLAVKYLTLPLLECGATLFSHKINLILFLTPRLETADGLNANSLLIFVVCVLSY